MKHLPSSSRRTRAPRFGQLDGMEPGDVTPLAPNFDTAVIGALDDAFDDIGFVAVAAGHELASFDHVARPARRASAVAMRSRSSAMSVYSRLPNGHSTGT